MKAFASTVVTDTIRQINLAAFGFGGFPGQPPVVGPFSVFDGRARYSQQDVRELVGLITTDLYLESVSGASRVDAARAQLKTAQKDSGVIAGIDVLREQVQLQAQQQRVVAAENELAKQKLNLARAIGLPQTQVFTQTDTFVTAPAALPALDQALTAALDARPDYRRANALVLAAEESRKTALGRRLPSLQVNADNGDIGSNPAFSHGTMGLQGTLLIPIHTGERARAEIMESETLLEERKAEASNVRDRIEYEIRTATLDIRSSLYALNVAGASLARAMGGAEKTIKSFFGGK